MKKLFIETYGCQMNVADSEVVASVMRMAGYETCETLDEADAVFLNTCSVRDNAEQKIINRLEALHALRRKGRYLIIGVLGCMAERVKAELIENHHVAVVAGPDAYLSLPDLIAQVELGHKAINVELSVTETYKDVIPQRVCGSHISGFVSIMRGCNNFCHYCIVPYTRGRERSRDVESILNEVRDLKKRGYKEVTLLGQNVNSYFHEGADGKTVSFPELLRLVAQEADGMRVRFTTSHPKDMSDDTLRVIAEEPNVCRHIHLPVQSGSNRILKLMNRKYTRMVFGPRGGHPSDCAGLRFVHRHFFGLLFRDRRGSSNVFVVDAGMCLRQRFYVQVFGAAGNVCLQAFARRRAGGREGAAFERIDRFAE